MNRFLPMVSALALLVAGCGEKKESAAPTKGAGNPITAPVDYLGAVGAAQKRSEKVVDLIPVQQAVQAFQAGEDRLPTQLQEIVTEGYLPRLPDLPKGSRFEYNPQSGRVRIVAAPPMPPGK